ncbi:hypothetical protein LBW62_25070 [Ralstonia solanacearum]|uniref:hypothetical protein n=1 Tax=Ralstonia solanacearum TaxID=305 RepID=UPI0005C45D1A|nr:hypothetical protein [Ralstonia solanacearum]MDB0544515.1 hypothetical protein [Ralstonia solanacearum]MDB0554312.1 hypothetical protein [Ralstonia solanacearum]MDB0559436.1 hypothetical protein [Ralstonia solanacearum]
MTKDEQQVLDRQVSQWTAELTRLAGQIAAAKGLTCAVVLITPRDQEGYTDVAPELVTEDAFGVLNFGWPKDFEVEVLNRSA